MKKYIYLFIFLACFQAYSQSFSVFDIDTKNFPIMKAKFLAFEKDGKQIRPNINDFSIFENGKSRTVLYVACPSLKPPVSLSSVLVFDVSGSMAGNPLDIEKDVANTWINMMSLGLSDCAITSFSEDNYINQDFTSNRSKLTNAIDGLTIVGGTDYNAALIDPVAGGILMAKTGKHKRIIIFLTDGQPDFEPKTQEIIKEANNNNISIYCLLINMKANNTLRDISNQTGGLCFENIKSKEEAEIALKNIFVIAQNEEFCEIEWQSEINCRSNLTDVEFKLNKLNLTANANYQYPNSSIAILEFNPISLNFKYSIPGIKKDTTISVTAKNANFNIKNIVVSNAAFTITPSSFSLKKGETQNLKVSFIPADSGYIYCKFTFENDLCPIMFFANGGYPGKKAAIRTLKLIQPNGGEIFVAGGDTVITWEGVPPDEPVTIEYRSDDDQPWIKLTDNAKGLRYDFHIPQIASNKYLARITAKIGYESNCTDVMICNKIWMGCNLDVDAYRNGDPIPQVKDNNEWINIHTGAWCYYNNDPAMEAIYGKLYNWYAINDPRGLAPKGWHIATDDEWKELEMCQGMSQSEADKTQWRGTDEGGKLKETETSHWLSPNIGATNTSGFTALPGGWRGSYNGTFYDNGSIGYWWSATEDHSIYAFYRYLSFDKTMIYRYSNSKGFGLSIRCVKDD